MVCVTEGDSVLCQLQYETVNEEQVNKKSKKNAQITVQLNNTVAELTEQISIIFSVDQNGIELFVKPSDDTELVSFRFIKSVIFLFLFFCLYRCL